MTDESHRALLDAWREQGADRLDPIRFHFMDALATRAARHEGEARRVLDEKLRALLDAYAADIERSMEEAIRVTERTVDASARGVFGELIDQLARAAAARSDSPVADAAAPAQEMELLGEFRKIWSSVRTESQLRQSMEDAPENAGPLNSRALVHRAVALMRELSPGYLQHFLAYIDDLSWIEQMNGSAAVASREASPLASPKKRSRAKAGTRRE
ncbi:DUF2894 domain-containing protein [Dyella japonica]|uniref:DUF2894 domain-containing protein n=1 Tax=Dyella japonica A8 TaxID=1217721 RepID=A0A075K9A8_9GAMM|nr:DUF2894 domain-containing protein [Dyella japonica]AIF48798.1 hypothetical protein HY57_16885 [Dyella japonica A8]